jgi:hypothetical protein
MNRTEIARSGGLALAARQSSLYFSFIGRRGGYKYMFNVYSRLAREYDLRTSVEYGPFFQSWNSEQIEKWNLERRAQFAESAEKYRLSDAGNMVMTPLWDRSNCPPRPRRRPARTEDVMLRRWEKAVQAW